MPSGNLIDDFSEGDPVAYIPPHYQAKDPDDQSYQYAEYGKVSSKNDTYVFVRFGTDTTGKSCYPRDLYKC
jgi:hypothetical protein